MATVSALGACRRARALSALGHDVLTLSDWFVCHPRFVVLVLRGLIPRIDPDLQGRIDRVYEARCMQPGSCRRTRDAAAAEGWAPPLAWDEDTLDDPGAEPVGLVEPAGTISTDVDEALVMRLLDRTAVWPTRAPKAMKDARAEAIRRMAAAGVPDNHAGARLGIHERTVARIRAEYGISPAVLRNPRVVLQAEARRPPAA